MQSVGRRYVRYVNRSYRRSGTLWEGRYKSTLIDSERYLLSCSRYIELNPVRAKMVAHPRDYPWSSYCSNAEGTRNALITAHPLYLQLGASTAARRTAYRAMCSEIIDERELSTLRSATETGVVLGDVRFRAEVESTLNRNLERLPVGGDRKSATFKQRHSIANN